MLTKGTEFSARFARHYLPTVRKVALHIANGVPATGDSCLPPEIGKLTLAEFLEKYDSSQMAFNPTTSVPRNSEPKIKKGKQNFKDISCRSYYQSTLNNARIDHKKPQPQGFDFLANYQAGPDNDS